MAYILGFIVTDGCLVEHENGYNALNITNKNKDILKNILEAMNSDHKISVKSRGRTSNFKYFQIQIRDKAIYADLLALGLTPRRSKTVRLPNVPYEYFGDFIRGCLDGDGSINVWQDPRWKHPWQTRVVFYSGSFLFLDDIRTRLNEEFGLKKVRIQTGRRTYVLYYSIEDSVRLYNIMYCDSTTDLLQLRYKRDKFEFFKKVRPDCFAKVIPNKNLAPSSSPV